MEIKRFFDVGGISSCCQAKTEKDIQTIYHELTYETVVNPENTICSACGRKLTIVTPRSKNYSYPEVVVESVRVFENNTYNTTIRICRLESHYHGLKFRDKVVIQRYIYKHIHSFNYKTGDFYYILTRKKPKAKKWIRIQIKKTDCFIHRSRDHISEYVKFYLSCFKHRAIELFPKYDLVDIVCKFFHAKDVFDVIKKVEHLDSGKYLAEYQPMFFKLLKNPEYAKIYKFTYVPFVHKKFIERIKDTNKTKDLVRILFNNPNVYFRKLLFDYSMNEKARNTAVIALMYFLYGFNQDRLRIFFQHHNLIDSFVYVNLGKRTPLQNPSLLNKFKKFVAEYGESRVLRHIVKFNDDYSINYFFDTFHMYNEWTKKTRAKLPKFSSLRATHDFLQNEIYKFQVVNEEIILTQREKSLEQSIEDIQFVLPRSTHELVDIGGFMDICVGAEHYRRGAVEKDMTIVVGKNSNNQPCICIELDSSLKVVRQAKLSHNRDIFSESRLYQIFTEWCRRNHLQIDM